MKIVSWLRDRWWEWRIGRKLRKAWEGGSRVRLDMDMPMEVSGFPSSGQQGSEKPVVIDVFVSDFGGKCPPSSSS